MNKLLTPFKILLRKTGLRPYWHKTRDYVKHEVVVFRAWHYNKYILPKILKNLKAKKKLTVLFFLPSLSMWKYEELFSLMLSSEKFNPCIIPCFFSHHTTEEQQKFKSEIIKYCLDKNFPFNDSYNIGATKNDKFPNINGDIIVYAQPYYHMCKNWGINYFFNKSVFIYTPYGVTIEKDKEFFDSLLQRISIILFYSHPLFKKIFTEINKTMGKRVCISGNSLYDQFKNVKRENPDNKMWKSTDKKFKRIIWAPHWTIKSGCLLQYSNFLSMADEMLKIAEEYSSKIQFIFKPHPYLLHTLYEECGKEYADQYYRKWETMPNTNIWLGDYIDLFLTSDGMIHDCSSFSNDYLYTKKPVMFISRPNHEEYLNDFGRECYNHHYIGRNMNDVRAFLDEIILKGEDTMKSDRINFYENSLLPPDNKGVGYSMFNAINNILS